ncbi:dTDP-4-dehydrorhamnose reductase [Aliikangiella marina]|uniref:dTDP-4-dehydrorhamnose reductase n=1 Tax=Aliikangiella marina TaxID=1712262 RepID=A0A545TBI3_9GAMM|nr:dTDP-4-dehydrorhamnose reductase [Aliikangiella marina]TQV74582.1 dTDP-4-dehydrorhamnose reductase [Aliikangiella marina]
MKILVIGKSGQVASELLRLGNDQIKITCLGRKDIDLFDKQSMTEALEQLKFDVLINASAYTAVDKAESDQEAAFALNATVVGYLAKYCADNNVYFLHISTDFVFDGKKSSPYQIEDNVKPIGVYGGSKAEGERLVWKFNAANSAVIRTSWVYSVIGNNFVKTMLRLMNDKQELGVVGDQIGSPTSAKYLARTLIEIAKQKLVGVYHWTDAGVASWYDFAVAIQELAIEKGLLEKAIPIRSIATSDYPTPAERPSYSVLDKSKLLEDCPGLGIEHWRVRLSEMISELTGMSGLD